MHFKADKTVSFVELDLEDMEQSVGGKGAWTWDDQSLCIYPGDAVVCFGLDNVVTPGKSYDSTFRILDVQGQELDAMPMKVMLVR
ncbi:MAG: hypothetical protein MI755_00120 [Sphingomonadales bacterium]|nr:hypothetical protein [Sphingomonadales bacterium]